MKRRLRVNTSAGVTFFLVATLQSPGAGSHEALSRLNSGEGIFRDHSSKSGIHLQNISGTPEKKFLLETMAAGCCLFDYDGDGWVDVYLVNGSTPQDLGGQEGPRNALYRNRCDGTFKEVTEEAGVGDRGWGQGCVVADFDNDGFPDLYLTNFGPNVLYRNRGDGTFTDVTSGSGLGHPSWSTGAAYGDFDGDSWLDLYVANYVDWSFGERADIGGFCTYEGVRVACGPRGFKGAPNALYHNNGDGTFSDVTRQAGVEEKNPLYGFGVIWSDFNSDSHLDLFVANDSTPNYLYLNRGDGTFEESGLAAGVAYSESGQEQAGMGVDVADYDNDGLFDLYVTNFSEDYNTLYQNLGQDVFSDRTAQAGLLEPTFRFLGFGTFFLDYDNDGWKDIFVANGHLYPEVDTHHLDNSYHQRNQLFRNLRMGKFSELRVLEFDVAKSSRGAAWADLDNDGDSDIVVVNIDEWPSVLLNEVGDRNNWIGFKMVGVNSNRDAVGALITVVSKDLVQQDEVRSGNSYLSHSDSRRYFGLESRQKVNRVTVRWPSGKLDEHLDLAANHLYLLKEGQPIMQLW